MEKGLVEALSKHGPVTNIRWGISAWNSGKQYHAFTAWTFPDAIRKQVSGLYEYVAEWYDCATNPGPAEYLERAEKDLAEGRPCRIVAVEPDESHTGPTMRVKWANDFPGWWKVTSVERDLTDPNHVKFRIEQVTKSEVRPVY